MTSTDGDDNILGIMTKFVPLGGNKSSGYLAYTDTSSQAITSGTYGFWCYSQAYAQIFGIEP